MQQPQFVTDQTSSPGEHLAHCTSISIGRKVRLLISIPISEQMMTCLDNHRTVLLVWESVAELWSQREAKGLNHCSAPVQSQVTTPLMAEILQQTGFADEEISKEVPTCSSHWLPCCRLQFPWSPWCNSLWGCSVNRLQTWASLNMVYKNALKQVLWSSLQHKPINNNSKTNRVEHCIPEHCFVQLCWKKPFIAKLHCETLTESILLSEGMREETKIS